MKTLALEACKRIVEEGSGCRHDALNPCWRRDGSGTPGEHWGGGAACGFCTAQAALANESTTKFPKPGSKYPHGIRQIVAVEKINKPGVFRFVGIIDGFDDRREVIRRMSKNRYAYAHVYEGKVNSGKPGLGAFVAFSSKPTHKAPGFFGSVPENTTPTTYEIVYE